MAQSTELYQANTEWRQRPGDERYLSVADLHEAVLHRHERAREFDIPLRNLRPGVEFSGDDGIFVRGASGELSQFTHHSIGQMASLVGAPAGYWRKLPAGLVAACMMQGLGTVPAEQQSRVMMTEPNGRPGEFRAFTSVTYGRIWDDQCTQAVMELLELTNGEWVVPAASYQGRDPKRATTLYASDHDVWMMLVNPSRPIELPGGDTLFPGFMVSNSEVGAATFELRTFWYRTICDNRIIWGAQNVTELKIKHTSGAPTRFAIGAAPALREFSEQSPRQMVESIQAAQHFAIPEAKEPEDVVSWLKNRGFAKEVVEKSVFLAENEEGEGSSLNLWGTCNGITAYARNITHTDDRIDLERRAGQLLQMAIK